MKHQARLAPIGSHPEEGSQRGEKLVHVREAGVVCSKGHVQAGQFFGVDGRVAECAEAIRVGEVEYEVEDGEGEERKDEFGGHVVLEVAPCLCFWVWIKLEVATKRV